MKKQRVIVAATMIVTSIVIVMVIFLVPNPLGEYIVKEAKANGYLEYTPLEAHKLAKTICTQCHSDERIKLYCPRCGPPFVVVVPHMQTFIDNYRITKPELEFMAITEHQAVAIVQVWNALVGNWEADFREQDILKLIGNYDELVALYKTPVDKRKIEYALSKRDDLKIGHMTGLKDAQKNLGKPENNPQGTPSGQNVNGSEPEMSHKMEGGHDEKRHEHNN